MIDDRCLKLTKMQRMMVSSMIKVYGEDDRIIYILFSFLTIALGIYAIMNYGIN